VVVQMPGNHLIALRNRLKKELRTQHQSLNERSRETSHRAHHRKVHKIKQGNISKKDHKQSKLANFGSHWQIILEIGMGLFYIVPGYRRADQ
jgi:uncharacterized membrane protein